MKNQKDLDIDSEYQFCYPRIRTQQIPLLIKIVFLIFVQTTLFRSFSGVHVNNRVCPNALQRLQTLRLDTNSAENLIQNNLTRICEEYLPISDFQRLHRSQVLEFGQLTPESLNYILE